MTLRSEFERLWPHMEAALEASGIRCPDGKVWLPQTKEDVWERIIWGRCHFWPGEESVIVTEFRTTPTGIKSQHNWLAGGNLEEIVGMMPRIEQWGRECGAHRQTGEGRRGWLRAFKGYREVGVRKEKLFV